MIFEKKKTRNFCFQAQHKHIPKLISPNNSIIIQHLQSGGPPRNVIIRKNINGVVCFFVATKMNGFCQVTDIDSVTLLVVGVRIVGGEVNEEEGINVIITNNTSQTTNLYPIHHQPPNPHQPQQTIVLIVFTHNGKVAFSHFLNNFFFPNSYILNTFPIPTNNLYMYVSKCGCVCVDVGVGIGGIGIGGICIGIGGCWWVLVGVGVNLP